MNISVKNEYSSVLFIVTHICTALDPINLLRETERQRQRERQRERLFQSTKPFTNGPAGTRKMELEDSNS